MASAPDVLAILLPVLVGIALIGIASLVVRHGQGARHNLFFAGLYILSGMKSVSEGLSLIPDGVHERAPLFPEALFWQFLALFCGVGLLPLLVLFVASFPHPAKWLEKSPARAAWAFVPAVLLVAVILLVVRGQAPSSWFTLAGRAYNYLLVAATVVALAWLQRMRSRSPDAIERKQATYVLLGFLPAFVLGWAITAVQELTRAGALDEATADETLRSLLQFVSPLLELVACSLVAFAILKYNILGIDPKFRLGVKSVTVGFLFTLIFLITQAIENLVLQGQVFSFVDDYTAGTGSFILSGVAGLVLFKPIEKASTKVSNKLLPPPEVAGGSKHAEEIYHAQASYVLRDAKVTDRELESLRNLREHLGLTEATARRIEEQVERILKVDDARLGQRATGQSESPSFTGLGVAKREAAAVADADLHVTRGAKAPPALPAAKAAKPAAPARPAAAKPGPPKARPAPAGAAKPASRPPAKTAPAGRTSKPASSRPSPAKGKSRKGEA